MDPRFRRTLAAAMLACASSAAADGGAPAPVIPPGQEALLGEIAGLEDKGLAGCQLESVTVEKAVVDIAYRCGAADVVFRLAHPSTVAEARARTKQFAIVAEGRAPTRLVDELVRRIEASESRFRWVGRKPEPPPKVEPPKDPDAPEKQKLAEAARAHFEARRHREALELYIQLAEKDPKFGAALGMVVANLAPTQPSAEVVARYSADADAHPEDPFKNFLAGVAAHYSAHYVAESREEKKHLYERSLHYLEKTRPDFDWEARVHIYLAVSHFRLGNQKEAERLIEEAIVRTPNDPDIYYCRAEIFHRTKVKRSIEDIDKYLALTRKPGETIADGKIRRVEEMRAYLVAVDDGERELVELWDPIVGGHGGEALKGERRQNLVLGALAGALGLGGGFIWWRRRRQPT